MWNIFKNGPEDFAVLKPVLTVKPYIPSLNIFTLKGMQDPRFNSLSRKTSRRPAESVIPESGSPGKRM